MPQSPIDHPSPSVFTRILAGELPGRFVWRDERAAALLTIAPITPGHLLVVPVEQIDSWTDVPAELWAHLMGVAQPLGVALQRAFDPVRVAVMVAGLEVPHCHVHLLPITSEADLSFARADPNAAADQLDEAAERIRTQLRALQLAGVVAAEGSQ